ncbi:MAG: zinc-ribbon domain-containing protein [Actinobacteria bacterium]|nr:zinc-ribbon domain-containing protein [Actinomycetota bacterium]
MRCPNCGYQNPEGRRYCEECGEKIAGLEAAKARARRKTVREAARLRLELEREGVDRAEVERRLRRIQRRRPSLAAGLVLIGVIVLVVVLFLAFTVIGGRDSAPERAVKAFYRAIKDKDVMAYLKLTEPEVYKLAQKGEYEPDPYTEGIDFDSYVVEDLKTRLVKEEGDYAEVEIVGGYFEGFYRDGARSGGVDFSQHHRLVRLVKVEGDWVIQDYPTAKLPYLVEEMPGDQSEFPEVEEGGGQTD